MSNKQPNRRKSNIHKRRELATLEHALRYRIVIPEALAECHPDVFPTPPTAKRTCDILQEEALLSRASLYWQKDYFFLTAKGSRRLRAVTAIINEKPLSESAKIHALAFVVFCCLQQKHRSRLTREEIKTHFNDLYRPGMPTNYYVDLSVQQPRIGFVRVDRGGHGRWDRIVAKAQNDIESHWLKPGFRQLIERERFELRIITSLPQKADRICRTLKEKANRRRVAVHVTAIPELINLIQPPSITAKTK